jgi:acyl dehydratase
MTSAVLAKACPRFEDLSVGQAIEPLHRGPLLPPHLMRWSAAIENWHRIHYDVPFATEHDGLPALLVNGSWKQHFVLQVLRRWLGTDGWVWKVDFQFRGMNVAGQTLTAWGEITGLTDGGDYGLVELRTGIRDENAEESTPGTATVVVPKAGGPAIPANRTALLDDLARRQGATSARS